MLLYMRQNHLICTFQDSPDDEVLEGHPAAASSLTYAIHSKQLPKYFATSGFGKADIQGNWLIVSFAHIRISMVRYLRRFRNTGCKNR